MGLLQSFLEILRRDEPEAVRHLDDSIECERERLECELRCEVYRSILLSKGETDASLARKVEMYRSARIKAA